MSDALENGICSIHQMQTVAVDTNPNSSEQELQLCVKCLATSRSALLNNEFRQLIKERKLKEYTYQQQQHEQRIENYEQLCQKLQNYSDLINGFITKILAQINQQIEKLKNEFSNIPQPQDQVMKEDLLIFTQKAELTQVTISTESERDFLLLIQEQIQKYSFEQQNLEIKDQLQKLLNIQQSQENESIIIDKDNQTKKTLSLDYCCNQHGKEIIMTTLDCDYQDERLFCAECLPDVKVKLTTLKEANNKWLIHQGKVYDSNNIFLNQREQKQQKIFQIGTKTQESIQQLYNELIQLIENQNGLIQTDILNLEYTKNKQCLFQLDLKMIKNIINILAQKEQMSQAMDYQQKLVKQDEQFETQIISLIKIKQISKDYYYSFVRLHIIFNKPDVNSNIRMHKKKYAEFNNYNSQTQNYFESNFSIPNQKNQNYFII